MALGKLGTVGCKDQRYVPKLGELQAKCVVDEDLAQGVWEMLLGAEVIHENGDNERTQWVGWQYARLSAAAVSYHKVGQAGDGQGCDSLVPKYAERGNTG